MKGIEVNEETLATDLIAKVGHEGAYLKQEHTRKHYRQEHHLPLLFHAQFRTGWKEAGAKEKTNRVLSEHHPAPLGADLEKHLDDLLGEAHKGDNTAI